MRQLNLSVASRSGASLHGTKPTFASPRLKARIRADCRRSALNVCVRAHCRRGTDGSRRSAHDPTRTKGRFRCCASGGLRSRLDLVSTAPEIRHWLSWLRFSGGLGKCPRIERVPWRLSRRSAKGNFHGNSGQSRRSCYWLHACIPKISFVYWKFQPETKLRWAARMIWAS
jgi:hypothetical protein